MLVWYPAQSESIWTLGGKWSLTQVHLIVSNYPIDIFQVSFLLEVNMYCLKLINQVTDVNILHRAIKVHYLKIQRI